MVEFYILRLRCIWECVEVRYTYTGKRMSR